LVRRFGPRVRLPATREAALKATREFERAAKISLDLSQQQMQTGYANILFLLNAQITYQNAVLARVQAQAARFADTAALFQALGGGWWNRVDYRPPAKPLDLVTVSANLLGVGGALARSIAVAAASANSVDAETAQADGDPVGNRRVQQ